MLFQATVLRASLEEGTGCKDRLGARFGGLGEGEKKTIVKMVSTSPTRSAEPDRGR